MDENDAFVAVPLEFVAGVTVCKLDEAALVGPARGVIESEAFRQERVSDLRESFHIISFLRCD